MEISQSKFFIKNENCNIGITEKKLIRTKTVFSIILAFSIVLNVYMTPFINSLPLGEFVFIVISPYFFLRLKKYIKYNFVYYVIAFLLYAFLINCVIVYVANLNTFPIFRLLRDLFYYLLIFVFSLNFFDYKIFRKYTIIISLALVTYVLIQTFVFYLTNSYFPGILPFMNVNDGNLSGSELNALLYEHSKNMSYIKANGFLCEPAHCATFFFFILLLLLFDDSINKRFVYSIFVSVGMIIIMSTSSILYLIFAWSMWFFFGKKSIKTILWFVFVIIIIFATIYVFGFDKINILLQRTETINNSGSSSYYRIMRGLDYYSNLKPFYKIVGIGFGNYENSISMLTESCELGNEYFNTLSYILISSGLIGLIFFGSLFSYLFVKCNRIGRLFILGLILIAAGSSIYSSIICTMFMSIIIYNYRGVRND